MLNSLILYVGQAETGRALAALIEARKGYVYLPENLMQALGMYITYFPQITIIDMSVDYAAEVFEHLRSVDASPILLLTNERIHSSAIYTIPPDAPAESLLRALEHLSDAEPNGVLHYA